jgi:predicted RNA binding protein YcfA (HicA-like mRNA interferase family)
MASCEKLLKKAKNPDAVLKFAEVVKLAECYGWEQRGHPNGSHHNYKNPNAKFASLLTFSSHTKDMSRYQVRNLLAAIEMLTDETNGEKNE